MFFSGLLGQIGHVFRNMCAGGSTRNFLSHFSKIISRGFRRNGDQDHSTRPSFRLKSPVSAANAGLKPRSLASAAPF